METPPGELPPFVAYRLNGRPIPLVRGGPVRMVVPWAHGFKSIKWLQRIVAHERLPGQRHLRRAATTTPSRISRRRPTSTTGAETFAGGQADDDARHGDGRLAGAEARRVLAAPRRRQARRARRRRPGLGEGEVAAVRPSSRRRRTGAAGCPKGCCRRTCGASTATGKPKDWPMRYSFCLWSVTLKDLKAGAYEFRVRTVDRNGFAQPEPRPYPRVGRTPSRASKSW